MKALGEFCSLYANRDTTEGRGPMFLVTRASTYAIAEAILKSEMWRNKYGIQGAPGDPQIDIQTENIQICESVFDFVEFEVMNLRAKALAKLSYEERKVLGLL